MLDSAFQPTLRVPGTTTRHLRGDPTASRGSIRYLATSGSSAPVILLHTVRTQAEHFHRVIPLIDSDRLVIAPDFPGMGYSEIVPGASYDEPALREAIVHLISELDLHDVTLVGESMGAVVALTVASALPSRVREVIAVNPYDYEGGIRRSGLVARMVLAGVTAPAIGERFAAVEPKPIMRHILRNGLVDPSALSDEYLGELLTVGKRPDYPVVAKAIYENLPSLIAARDLYAQVRVPVQLVYGERDWSRRKDRNNNESVLPRVRVTHLQQTGHFVALERPGVISDLLAGSTGM